MFEFNRRFVLIPTILAIALLVSSFYVQNDAQTRLASSTSRVHEMQERQNKLGIFMQLMLDAETGQRGFLLSGKDSYLASYRTAVTQRSASLDELRKTYADDPVDAQQIEALDGLAADLFDQLERALTLQKTNVAAAIEFVRSGPGSATMLRIRATIGQLQLADISRLEQLKAEEHYDLVLMRVIGVAVALLNIILVLTAATLISRNIRRRALDAHRLTNEKAVLENEVRSRTYDLTNLSNHLQQVTEQEKAALARELHDELGGILVSAKMDISWLRRRATMEDADSRLRWERVLGALDSGVDMKRRVVEQLRPTLLDNMGLNTALRWQLQESCGRAGLFCTEELPDDELPISTGASIAIFRVAQEAMTNILKHAKATEVFMSVVVSERELLFSIRDNGVGITPTIAPGPGSHGFLSMRHRVQSLGGVLTIGSGKDGKGTEISMRLPLKEILVAPAA
jgi:signal transduction histidine kinase